MNKTAFWNFLTRLYGENRDPNTFMQLMASTGQAPGVPVYGEPALRKTARKARSYIQQELSEMTFTAYDFNDLLMEKGQMRNFGVKTGVSSSDFFNRLSEVLRNAANDNWQGAPKRPSKAA